MWGPFCIRHHPYQRPFDLLPFVAPFITRRRDHDIHAFDCHLERQAQRVVAHAGDVLHVEGEPGFLLKGRDVGISEI